MYGIYRYSTPVLSPEEKKEKIRKYGIPFWHKFLEKKVQAKTWAELCDKAKAEWNI